MFRNMLQDRMVYVCVCVLCVLCVCVCVCGSESVRVWVGAFVQAMC